MAGQVVHFEVPADNVERAQNFYRDAFGWQIQPVPEMSCKGVATTETGPDGMPKSPGSINGGMAQRGGNITSPVITISVDDIDEALAKIESLGGKTAAGRMAVGDMGFAGYFVDTEGNTIGLWQNAS
jgi:uncharacterized protein